MFHLIKLKKISWKLTILYAFIFSLILIALNIFTLYGVRYYLIRQVKTQVSDSSKMILRSIDAYENVLDLKDPELYNQSDLNASLNISITDTNGNLIKSTNKFYDNEQKAVSSSEIIVEETNDKHLVFKNSPIIVNEKTIAYLHVAYNMNKEYEFLKLLMVILAFTDFFGILLSIGVGYVISRKILNPIDKITTAAKQISVSDLESRMPVGETDDELTRLAITFNEMLDRLKLSFEKQNQFVSDASHELRTPIAVIRGYADLIDRWGKNDQNILDESIHVIKKETESMTYLIEKLLFLARSDSDTIKLQKENADIGILIDEVVRESKIIAPNHHISTEQNGTLMLHADRKLLKEMLRALVDNSIKFTPEGGNITIFAEEKANDVIIEVKDTGIGISQEEIDKVFNRFYRIDKARTKENGGTGLGLSIVKWIVEAHNGTVSIETQQENGTCIHIKLTLY